MKISNEVKTAILAIVAIVLLIFGYSFLKGKNLLDSSRTFYAVYDEVEGLSPSSAVTINGLKVGQVTDINFLNKQGQLLVTFTVNKMKAITKISDPKVVAKSRDGGVAAKAIEGEDNKAPPIISLANLGDRKLINAAS